MSIDTLQDWNQRLGDCGCCPMPECPAPDSDGQAVSRTLTAMTGSPSSYSIGVPSLEYGTDPGEVPPIERFVLYQFMRGVKSHEEGAGIWTAAQGYPLPDK